MATRQDFKRHPWEVIASALLSILFIVLIILPFYDEMWIIGTLLLILLVPICGYCAALMPRYTIDTPEHIEVKLLGGKRLVFDKANVQITPAPNLKACTIRTFGSWGFMGFTGRYWNKELGHFKIYARNTKDLVLITDAEGHKTIINYRIPQSK